MKYGFSNVVVEEDSEIDNELWTCLWNWRITLMRQFRWWCLVTSTPYWYWSCWLESHLRKDWIWEVKKDFWRKWHCVKSVHIRRIFLICIFPHSDWIQRCSVSLRIQSECEKIMTRKTPNTDTFHTVWSKAYLKPCQSCIL